MAKRNINGNWPCENWNIQWRSNDYYVLSVLIEM